MPNTSPVILILGAGSNIGHHVARAFAAKGYKVALAARRLKEADNNADQINIPSDLSDPSSVVNAFSKVNSLLGVPSVVIYNGEDCYPELRRIFAKVFEAGAVTANDPKNPLSLPLTDFTRDLNINTTSAFVAAQQAVLAFEQLPDSASRTFIYTGNILNTTTLAPLLDLGVGKSATAHIIQSAAAAYKDRGFKYAILSRILLAKKLTSVGSTMVTSGRPMGAQNSASTEKPMVNYM
jgi:NAD(P)-dependent dehydrogenase (short-subunit alcohol dehydrogenase family)